MSDARYKLHAWLSPAYPVGAYTYSHGLEWAFAAGLVQDSTSTSSYIEDCLQHGSGRTDAILLAHAWKAQSSGDIPALEEISELAIALAPSAERVLETEAQGAAFASVTEAAWGGGELAVYPVAVGRAAAMHNVPLEDTLATYLQAFAANLISAAVRLVPLGQTDGARIAADLMNTVQRLTEEACTVPLDAIGGCAMMADIASMRHETQTTRLFRS
ncbi:MAG: urease accessory protein UreF [Paracoccaceae bacterium]